VQLESNGKMLEYFLTAWVSGYTYKIEDREIRIVSAQSPFGIAMNGKSIGDSFAVIVANQEKDFEILNII
jgi:transcription elongation GreA/GreB family factor